MKRLTDHKTWVEVSKRALISNARCFKARIGKGPALMAVVKSNAYGHGLKEVAKSLAREAAWFGVDNIDEAQALKKARLKQPVLILGWTPSWRLEEAIRRGYRLTVSTPEHVKAAKAAAAQAGKNAYLHLKIDTGTTRQGADLKRLPDVADVLRSSKRLVLEGLSTHYANIEDTTDHAFAARQLERFGEAERYLDGAGFRPTVRHTACTAAAMLCPETHFDMVRVGLGLYGLWPSRETKASTLEQGLEFDLQPVLAWRTRIAMIRDVKRGTPVSYGLTETMKADGRVAVLPVGYWDGYDRGLSSVGEVLIRGHRAKVIGRVCMNMMMVDASGIPEARPEDIVTLLGSDGKDSVTAEEIASKIGTINYEVVTRINPLLPRITI